MIQINQEILSFYDIPVIAERSKKMILLIRHSYRKSLQEGSFDPGLTEEGTAYAKECGALLKGLKDVCYGSSARRRTVETVQALIEGGSLEPGEITIFPQIYDCSLFEPQSALEVAIENGRVPSLLKNYFETGKAETMVELPVYHQRLMEFLTETVFLKKNVILATHDIVAVSVLLPLNVYQFQQSDWCGYIQGAALYQSDDGVWTVSYVVPDKAKRDKQALFI